jgi:hypothetical protein
VPVITRRERAVAVTAITLMAGGILALILGALIEAPAIVIGALAVIACGAGMAFGIVFLGSARDGDRPEHQRNQA